MLGKLGSARNTAAFRPPRRACVLLLITSLFMGVNIWETAQAHSEEDPMDLRHWEIASADPDRIFLSFYGDPASARAVTWRTGGAHKTPACAEIGKALGGPGFTNALSRIPAKTEILDLKLSTKNKQGSVNYHSVVFKDLEPDTLYAYRVGDGAERWSEWIQFRTASRQKEPFRFLYFGDAQNDLLTHWSRTIRMANQMAPDARFALHAGDLINNTHVDLEWAGWFKAGGFLHSQWSGIPVAGNHEYRREKQSKVLSMQWRPQFTLPVAGELPERLHETVYSIDYQGLQVIVLNSNELIEEQTAYLEKQLKKPGNHWKIVTFHHPIFSPRRGVSTQNSLMAAQWKPLFEKYNVDVVLQGHDHLYTRGQVPVRNASGFVRSSFQTMYVTTVSGPKQYGIKYDILESYAEKGLQTLRKGEQTQFFQVISVDGNKLTYQAYTAAGELYDAATISKDFKSGKKTIRQDIPALKERTFDNTPGTKDSHK
ncbi:fibronectin type III domain-containing protein [Planctomycetota bacterium]